jgi:hypothetical protein
MCGELYRYSLCLDVAIDGLFRQRMRPSVFLQDNCHGISVVRAGDRRSNSSCIGPWTHAKSVASGVSRFLWSCRCSDWGFGSLWRMPLKPLCYGSLPRRKLQIHCV